jgi:hypothetical protein
MFLKIVIKCGRVDGKSTVWLKILFQALHLVMSPCLTVNHVCSPPVCYHDSNSCFLFIVVIHVDCYLLVCVLNMVIH